MGLKVRASGVLMYKVHGRPRERFQSGTAEEAGSLRAIFLLFITRELDKYGSGEGSKGIGEKFSLSVKNL